MENNGNKTPHVDCTSKDGEALTLYKLDLNKSSEEKLDEPESDGNKAPSSQYIHEAKSTKDIDVLENSRNNVMKEIAEENEQNPSFHIDIKGAEKYENKSLTFGPRVFSIHDQLEEENKLN